MGLSEFIYTYGKNTLDYFSLFPDKEVFWSSTKKACLTYKRYGNFCIVLGYGVGKQSEDISLCNREFSAYMKIHKTIVTYYRVPKLSSGFLPKAKKGNHFAIGEEGIIDLTLFSLQQSCFKNLRNTVNKCIRLGYTITFIKGPLSSNLKKEIFAISDEWLSKKRKKELGFSQGYLTEETIDIYDNFALLYNQDNKLMGFGTFFILGKHIGGYDLIRYDDSITNGMIDYLLTSIIIHLKEQGCTQFSLGMTPLLFSTKQKNLAARSLFFIGRHFNSLHHYKNLRHFKQKYNPQRETRYFICNPIRVVQFSLALRKSIVAKKLPKSPKKKRKLFPLPY